MQTPPRNRTIQLAFASLLMGTAVVPARAQQAEPPTTVVLDEIILTGEKRDRSVRDTAASVVAQTDADLQKKSSGALNDALSGVPNVIYTDTVGAPVIRGQDTQGPNFGSSAFFGGTLPRATTNLDGHYLSYFENVFGTTSVWDVDTIEVFRGPQTTAQGTNSIAGALIVRTKDPDFVREGAVQLQYGSRSAYRASLMASGPLSDTLAARLTLDTFGRDTFIHYTNPAFAPGNHDFSSQTGRLKLLWRPADMNTEVKLTFSHDHSNRPTIEARTGDKDNLDSATLSMPNYRLRNNTIILDANHEFGNGVRLIGQIQHSDMHVNRIIEPIENGGATIKTKSTSGELRAVFGETASPVSGVAGIFRSHMTSDDTLNSRGVSHFDDTKDSLGLFGEVSYRFADRWTLTGALRYQSDDITRRGTAPFAPGVVMNYDRTFDAWLPKLSLAYQVNPEWTVGGLVSRGYNPGGINLSFATRKYLPFDAETVNNYELFARGALMDGRMNVSGNLFYADYRHSQRLLPDYVGGLPYGVVVVNADKARAYGLEAQADYQVNAALKVRGGLGLLHTSIGSFTDALGASYKGNEFARSPGYMVSLGVEWEARPDLRLSADVRHVDGYYSDDENKTGYAVDAYTIANARVSYMPRQGMELYAYADNIFDSHAATWKFDDRTAGGIASAVVKPREVGIGLRMDF